MTSDDSYMIATALSYAIAAVEKLPAEWRDEAELTAMRALLERILPGTAFCDQFVEVSRAVLDGNEKPYERPRLV